MVHSISGISFNKKRRRAVATAGRFRAGVSDLSVKHDDYLSVVYSNLINILGDMSYVRREIYKRKFRIG